MNKRLFSFDIFDTCFTRACGDYSNFLYLLANDVLGNTASDADIADFIKIRVAGVSSLRKKTNKEDFLLSDIYKQCDYSTLCSYSDEELVKMEISLEKRVLVPVVRTLELVNCCRGKGQIAYITDMHLPESFLKQLLIQHGFFQEGDYIFVSGEIGKTKRSGTLFKYVKDKIGIKYNSWHHYGDNHKADYTIPKRLGIHAHRLLYPFSYVQNEYNIRNHNVIHPTNKIIAGLCRSMAYSFPNHSRALFAADYIAPLYVPFVYHVLEHAKESGIKNLFFLARDGIIFKDIANQFNDEFPEIKTHILYVSRKSLYLPISDLSYDSILSMVGNMSGDNKTRTDNFQVEFPEEFASKTYQTKEQIALELFRDNNLLGLIRAKRDEQKKYCLQYFEQTGLAVKDYSSAIVDLGGTRKCQQSINKVLADGGYCSVYGYYLEVQTGRKKLNRKDLYDAVLFKEYYPSNPSLSYLNRMSILSEHYFSVVPEHRTSHYQIVAGKVAPVFDSMSNDIKEQYRIVYEINKDVCCRFAQFYKQLNIQKYSNQLIYSSACNISSLLSNPKKEYLAAIKGVFDQQNKYKIVPIITRISPFHLISITKYCEWEEGSLVLTYGLLFLRIYTFSKIIKDRMVGLSKTLMDYFGFLRR